MVASHDTGVLVRSLVRIPGSGCDRNLSSVCLDLSKVSSSAAAVSVPSILPEALARPQLQPQNPGANNMDKIEKDDLNKRKMSCSPENPARTTFREDRPSPPAPKRPRLIILTPHHVMSNQGQQIQQATFVEPGSTQLQPMQQVQLQLHPQQQPQLQQSVTIVPSSAVGTTSLSEMLQDLDVLRKENGALQHRLSLFQQLFRDKKRLTSLVQRIGIKVE